MLFRVFFSRVSACNCAGSCRLVNILLAKLYVAKTGLWNISQVVPSMVQCRFPDLYLWGVCAGRVWKTVPCYLFPHVSEACFSGAPMWGSMGQRCQSRTELDGGTLERAESSQWSPPFERSQTMHNATIGDNPPWGCQDLSTLSIAFSKNAQILFQDSFDTFWHRKKSILVTQWINWIVSFCVRRNSQKMAAMPGNCHVTVISFQLMRALFLEHFVLIKQGKRWRGRGGQHGQHRGHGWHMVGCVSKMFLLSN